MSGWIDHWGCLPLCCQIGAPCHWLEILRQSRARTYQANIGIFCWRQAWIWQQRDHLKQCGLGRSSCCAQLWWGAASDLWSRHSLCQKRSRIRQQKVEAELPCCWNWLVHELSVSMKLLFCQVVSSHLGSGPVDRWGNHFDMSPRMAPAHGMWKLWSCMECWSWSKGNCCHTELVPYPVQNQYQENPVP